jgi:hypothetical protein
VRTLVAPWSIGSRHFALVDFHSCCCLWLRFRIAEFERGRMGERVRAELAGARIEGTRLGCPPRRSTTSHTFTVSPFERSPHASVSVVQQLTGGSPNIPLPRTCRQSTYLAPRGRSHRRSPSIPGKPDFLGVESRLRHLISADPSWFLGRAPALFLRTPGP